MAELYRVESVVVEHKLAVIAALAEYRLCVAMRDELDCGAEIAEVVWWATRAQNKTASIGRVRWSV